MSGWKEFFSKLDKLGINRLKNYENIPEYYTCADGDQEITIEIASPNKYQRYSYPCWNIYSNKLKEVKNIWQMLELIQREFNFNLLPWPKSD